MKLLMIGAGGHGKCCYEIAQRMQQFDVIDFVDDKAEFVFNKKVVGTSHDLKNLQKEYDYAFVAIGNNQIRLKILRELKNDGYKLATLIDPFAYVSNESIIKEGCVLFPFACVENETSVDEGCIICSHTTIHHNVILNEGCLIYSNCVVRPNVVLEKESRIESGSVIKEEGC